MAKDAKVSKQLGRPTLSEFQQGEVFAALSPLKAKTPEYRQARRALAVKMERTERSIDYIYERIQAARKPKKRKKDAA